MSEISVRKIGVIGAGVMGRGVAQTFAQNGYGVILIDISEEILAKAKEEISNSLRLYTMFHPDKLTVKPEEALSQIEFTTSYNHLADVTFVIENVSEKWEVKEQVYATLSRTVRQDCILAVNTSCISITRIGALTKQPERVIGTHFMNPVPLIQTIEVIRGFYTSDETIEKTKDVLSSIDKDCVIVQDSPGFVSNRISHLLMNEAAFVVQDQVASAHDVDEIFKRCYGHKMGPLETADLIGLDTVVDSLEVLYQDFQDPKYRCCPLLKRMVSAGLTGKKSGQGFFIY